MYHGIYLCIGWWAVSEMPLHGVSAYIEWGKQSVHKAVFRERIAGRFCLAEQQSDKYGGFWEIEAAVSLLSSNS